jgi:DNA-binding MarR family transcriptional regulator
MVPMMAGMLATSILSGQLISRWGRYKVFPILGTAVMAVGLFLLSRMTPETPRPAALGIILVLGMGLGLVMQVLIVAVQNAVEYTDVGVATSGAMLFRLIGGSLGTAVLGALFSSRLAANLAHALPGVPAAELGGAITHDALAALSPAMRAAYAVAFTQSLSTVFLVAMGVAAVGFLIAWRMPERPLRATIAASAADVGTEMGESFPQPVDPEPLAPLMRGLAALADRDVRRQHIEKMVARAGVSLSPAAAWLLLRLEEDERLDPVALGREYGVPEQRMRQAVAELRDGGLIAETGNGRVLTDEGCALFTRIAAARREHLAELFADWPEEKHEELAAVLRKFVRDLVPDARPR